MAQKAIRECDGKRLLARWLRANANGRYALANTFLQITPDTSFGRLTRDNPWLLCERLVVKPDQLIKRRGKADLLLLDAPWDVAQPWIECRMGTELQVGSVCGVLDHFIVEPFVPHAASDEYYLAIRSVRAGDEMLFHHEGGVDVGDVDAKARRFTVPIGQTPTADKIAQKLLGDVPAARRDLVAGFLREVFTCYVDLHIAYLEMNPFVVTAATGAPGAAAMNGTAQAYERVVPLDLAVKLDDTAEFECGPHWGKLEFPAPFGRALMPEEQYVKELDAQSGASLKLTILNPAGRIWTMVAGGGASVSYADTVSDLGFAHDLANYGEYSGDPSEGLTYEYARTILSLMTREPDPHGKVLLIGGGIANFTNVANTFKGIVRALKDYEEPLRQQKIHIYVRRGGPNYQEGLLVMRELGRTLGVPIAVYGPETHMTAIVSTALASAANGKETAEV